MSCLNATFTLTPVLPTYQDPLHNMALLYCYGADFWPWDPNLTLQYANNRFFFDASFAADPNLDYSQWANRVKARHLQFYINLTSYKAANKQLALIFGFDVAYTAWPGRVLVYSDNGLLFGGDQTIVYGDNQFLLEIDSSDSEFFLYFIHAGGHWFFRGLSGYVV
jgi:hypothetical protein